MADGSAKTFSLSVVTPEGAAFEGEAERLIVPGADGEIGVLARHAPLVAMLKAGEIRIRTGGAWQSFAAGPGYFKVQKDRAIVLVDDAVRAEDIDAGRGAARDRGGAGRPRAGRGAARRASTAGRPSSGSATPRTSSRSRGTGSPSPAAGSKAPAPREFLVNGTLGAVATATTPDTTAEARLRDLLEQRILVLDGAWGTMLQGRGLTEADFRGERFRTTRATSRAIPTSST